MNCSAALVAALREYMGDMCKGCLLGKGEKT